LGLSRDVLLYAAPVNIFLRYVLEMLFENQPPSAFDVFKGQVKKIRSLVKKSDKDVLPR